LKQSVVVKKNKPIKTVKTKIQRTVFAHQKQDQIFESNCERCKMQSSHSTTWCPVLYDKWCGLNVVYSSLCRFQYAGMVWYLRLNSILSILSLMTLNRDSTKV